MKIGNGSRWVIPGAVVASAVAACLLLPAGAAGHAGEVHSEEPTAPPPVERGEGASGKRAESDEKAPPGKPPATNEVSAAPAPEVPPPPEEPESDPALHFALLGALALAGAGFLLVRRRRVAG